MVKIIQLISTSLSFIDLFCGIVLPYVKVILFHVFIIDLYGDLDISEKARGSTVTDEKSEKRRNSKIETAATNLTLEMPKSTADVVATKDNAKNVKV